MQGECVEMCLALKTFFQKIFAIFSLRLIELGKNISQNRIEGVAGGGGHCVLKWGFTWTFPRNQDATMKEISISLL